MYDCLNALLNPMYCIVSLQPASFWIANYFIYVYFWVHKY